MTHHVKRTLLIIGLLGAAGCTLEPARDSASMGAAEDVGAASAASTETRELRRGEVGCEPDGPSLVPLGPWDTTYDVAAMRTDGCRGRLGLSRGTTLAEVVDPEPRMYAAAMGTTLADGTRVLCANVLDAWATDDVIDGSEVVYRVARVDIWCTSDAGGAWAPLRPAVSASPDAAWLQEVSVHDGALQVGFLRDSRFAYADFNGRGRPASDGAYHAHLGLDASGELAAGPLVFDEGYPWGEQQAVDDLAALPAP